MSRSSSYWIPLAWIRENGVLTLARDVRINVSDGRFEAIENGVSVAAGDERLTGVACAGIANCHSHTFQRALRGLGRAGETFWSWREVMYEVANRLTPELYYRFATAVYREMLMAGYTSVAEFHYVHHRPSAAPYADPNEMGKALIQAAADVGIRLTLLDTCYLHADVDASPLSPAQGRFGDGTAQAWQSRVQELCLQEGALRAPSSGVSSFRMGAAIHSVRACQPEEMKVVADWARSDERPLHVHLSEQEKENVACERRFGMSPTRLLESVGAWGPDAVAVHATKVSADDVSCLEHAGASVCLCPSTEADLADGIAPLPLLSSQGIDLCIGSDENVSIDPFDEMRLIERCHRLVTGRRDACSGGDLIDAATRIGHRSIGWADAGAIEVGRLADWIVVDTSDLRFAGIASEDLLLTATPADVSDVFVDGRRVASGRHRNDVSTYQVINGLCRELRGEDVG